MRAYDYKNVQLIPRKISSIGSRDTIDCSSTLGNLKLDIPIIAPPMVDVIDGEVGRKITDVGALGINHRFQTIENQLNDFLKNGLPCAVGVTESINRINHLYQVGCRYFCIDVANGATTTVKELLVAYEKIFTKAKYIVGNVCSKEGFDYLQNLPNVVGIRTGVSGGEGCSTKNCTGIYFPAISLIIECKSIKKKGIALIADGGIKEPQDMCKAIAFGADMIMMGSVLSRASDSPAKLIEGKKVYRGSASADIQRLYKEKPKYVEGKVRQLEPSYETVAETLIRFKEGLLSSMSYFDAKNIKEYQNNLDWCII